MQGPPVIAVIPVFNHARWVKGALDSVVSQDYENKGVIVVDDASSDGSSDVVQGLIGRSSVYFSPQGLEQRGGEYRGVKVVLVRLPPAPGGGGNGPSFARNMGVRIGWESAEAFFFLDSDDEYLPHKMSKSVQRWLQDRERVGVVYSDYETFNETTGLRMTQYKEPWSRQRLLEECLPNSDSLVSKMALEKGGLWDESLRTVEDLDRWLAFQDAGFILSHLAEPLLRIRVGAHSSTSTVAKHLWEANYRRVAEKAQQRMAR